MTTSTPFLSQAGAERLAAAVLSTAITEALGGQAEAIYWLMTGDAVFYARLTGRENADQLATVARKCQPGRRIITGRANAANVGRALYGP